MRVKDKELERPKKLIDDTVKAVMEEGYSEQQARIMVASWIANTSVKGETK